VPLNNGFGTDEEERLLRIGPDLPSGDPEQVAESSEPRFTMSTLEHHELLSKREIFKSETTTGGKETSHGAEDKP
jgi:hypothetical protein